MEIKEFIEKNKQNMIDDLSKLISYDSVSEFTDGGPYPFGEETAKVLDETLAMFEREGMKTKNVDYYAGYGEVGEGKELVGVLAHLDIVPCGKGWETDPLKLTIIDGKMHGRGVIDDKGPVISSLYAIKYLLENNIKLNKRIRLIVGLNEEKGSHCLNYYVKKEGHIDCGFTPDGSFPGIHGEKGSVSALFESNKSKIISITGGTVPNAVCYEVNAAVPKDGIDVDKLKNYFETNPVKYDIKNNENLEINVTGVAAHASTPEEGVNAISYLMAGLAEAGFDDDFVNYYNKNIGLYTNGYLIGCDFKDEYGELTFNCGVINMVDGKIQGTIDIRVPVNCDNEKVVANINSHMNNENGKILNLKTKNSLFFEPDSPMIKALVNAYAEVTGDNKSKPMVIGGGTYSKGINNCIAFGAEFPGINNHMHDVGEFMFTDNFWIQTEIYIKALMNLLDL